LLSTTSCVETILVGSIATAVVVKQDKSVENTKNDILISANIDQKFIQEGLKNPTNKIGVSVDRQRVLLTGIVSDENMVKKANELAWKVGEVKEVIDEIQVNENKSWVTNSINYFKDLVITSQIKSKALLDKNISSANFKVITINKIVYLLGSAKNQSEIKAINELAAKTLLVKKVVSHIILDEK
jgi:osmotically-inducible protein OsmY